MWKLRLGEWSEQDSKPFSPTGAGSPLCRDAGWGLHLVRSDTQE